jgi:hypothetical protein
MPSRQRTGFWLRGSGFILDSECTSRVIIAVLKVFRRLAGNSSASPP